MSRSTISTGAIDLSQSGLRRSPNAGRILILGDFGANASRGASPAARLRMLSRDNIDEVFAALQVALQLPLCDAPLQFSEPEQLHPDELYRQIDLFSELRSLRRRLQQPATFQAAAAELAATAYHAPQDTRTAAATTAPAVDNTALPTLDALLAAASDSSSTDQGAAGRDTAQMIRDIVAPYITPAASPEQLALQNSVEQASRELLRALIRQPAFRDLEARWLGLRHFLRRMEGDPAIRLCDGHPGQWPELLAEGGDLDRLLHQNGYAPDIIVADMEFGASVADAQLAQQLALFAERHSARAIAGGTVILAGGTDLQQDPDLWHTALPEDAAEAWTQLRQQQAADHLALALPRFLLRLPYGRKTSPLECMDFEEVGSAPESQALLWGNAAWLAALALNRGQAEIESLPVHLWQDDEGDSLLQTSVEVLLNDRAAHRLEAAGLLAVRGDASRASAYIPRWNSLKRSRGV